MSLVADPLRAGREAAARHAWRDAHDAYAGADAAELTAEDLELFADAAWWTGRLDRAIELREDAYARFAAAGERMPAVRVALRLSMDHEGRGALSVQQGWLAKAERLLEGLPESHEHGMLAIDRAHSAIAVFGDVTGAMAHLDRADEIGERLGDRDVQTLSRAIRAAVLVRGGDVDRGLAMLDECAATAVCGELRPLTTSLVYCCTISSCEAVGDYRRAAEWTAEANRWCDRQEVSGFPGSCRVHRAQIMRLRGDWPEAEEQALAACQELRDFDRHVTAAGFYEVAEIRRRRGDFSAAAEMYSQADQLGHDAQPGLALLRLAEGKVDSAVAAIRRALDDVEDPLMRVRRLPAQVEIMISAGDMPAAQAAAEELEGIVARYHIGDRPAPAFEAACHLAFGQIALASGQPQAAARFLRQARADWQAVGAPYETAQARMLLGLAYRRAGDEDGAVGELEAALATFERLGARLDEERVKELLGRLETRRTFVFTDIVGSTRLLETLGDDKWRKLLARHDALLRERIADAGGEIVKHTGDGFFASFHAPKPAVEAAIAIQRALDGEIVAPDVRIGVHSGGAFHPDGEAGDYGGQGVHVAARVGALAGAGEILASRETLAGIETFRLSEPRSAELKGLAEPVELVAVDWR
jgi:class 3 adenylate cyclase